MYLHKKKKRKKEIKEAKLFHIHDSVLKSLVFEREEKKKNVIISL